MFTMFVFINENWSINTNHLGVYSCQKRYLVNLTIALCHPEQFNPPPWVLAVFSLAQLTVFVITGGVIGGHSRGSGLYR